jgi:hypothetical protein
MVHHEDAFAHWGSANSAARWIEWLQARGYVASEWDRQHIAAKKRRRPTDPLPQIHEIADLADIVVIWGSLATLAGVIELDPASDTLIATRSNRTSRWPTDRLATTSAAEAVAFLTPTTRTPAPRRHNHR